MGTWNKNPKFSYSMILKSTIEKLEDERKFWLANFSDGVGYGAMDIDFDCYCEMRFGLTHEQFNQINKEANERKKRSN